MTRIRFHIDDMLQSATITASSEASNYPATNVANPIRTKVWRSTGTASEYIRWDAGESVFANYIALIEQNIWGEGTYRLTATNNSDYVSDLVLDETFYPVESYFGYGESGYGEHGYGGSLTTDEFNQYSLGAVVLHYFGLTEARYWSLYPSSSGVSYYEIGRIMVGKYFEPAYNPAWGVELGVIDRTKIIYAEDGTPWADLHAKKRYLQFTFKQVADGDLLWNFYDMFYRYGKRQDFVVSLFPDSSEWGTANYLFYTLYGRFRDAGKVQKLNLNRNQTGQLIFYES